MTTIIFNATVADGSNEFIAAIEELCNQRGTTVDIKYPTSDVCIIIANKPPTGPSAVSVPSDMPTEVQDSEQDSLEAPAVVIIKMPDEEIDSGATSSEKNDDTQLGSMAISQPSGEVVVLSLTTACAIPTYLDCSRNTSKLYVSCVESAADCLIFEYCGSTFKFPIILESQANSHIMPDIINNFDEGSAVSNKMIRIVIQFTESTQTYPIAVELCEKMPNEVYHMVFGNDLAHMIGNANVSISEK